jgi:hypothetical protein
MCVDWKQLIREKARQVTFNNQKRKEVAGKENLDDK